MTKRHCSGGIIVVVSSLGLACTEPGEDPSSDGSTGADVASTGQPASGDGSSTSVGASSSGAADSGSSEASTGDDSGDDTTGEVVCPTEPVLDVVFAEVPGIDPNLLSLDVYPAGTGQPSPMLVMVHGGGWVTGDKESVSPGFLGFFEQEGITVVNTNYRLIGDAGSPDATWADQPTDVAAAIAWAVDNADALCIDVERVALMGHSAGAHLVALVATDNAYLGAHGLDVTLLDGVVPLDVSAYDIPFAIDNGPDLGVPSSPMNLSAIFTNDPAQQVAASPITHVSADAGHPAFFIVWAPIFNGLEQTLSQVESERFAEALLAAGVDAEVFGSLDDDHSTLAGQFGQPGDEPTDQVREFLQSVL